MVTPLLFVPVFGVNNSSVGGKWFDEARLAKAKGTPFDLSPCPLLDKLDAIVRLSRTYHEFKNDFVGAQISRM